MKIYLYLPNRIMMFKIPVKVSGSFSFDENPEAETKLINVEARNSEWYLYAVDGINLYDNDTITSSTKLESNKYYILQRNNINYLIFVTTLFDNTLLPYLYKKDINLVIGNNPSCNINYSCKYITKEVASIKMEEDTLILEKKDSSLFLNNKSLPVIKCRLNYGDEINICGLRIIIFNGFILINNPLNAVSLDFPSSHIIPYKFQYGSNPEDFEIHDKDLYEKEDYFSKAPRLRRTIETKEINLSPPPRKEGENGLPTILTIGPMLTMGATSIIMLINNIVKIRTGQATINQTWPQLATSGAMLISTLLWPNISNFFNKRLKAKKRKELIEKYTKYLDTKKEELKEEVILQKGILIENYPSIESCLQIIDIAKINFWDKKIEQNDFLDIRVGRGDILLDVKINYPEEGFTIEEDDLKNQADQMVEEYKYIKDVPVGYSLYKNKITAIMGEEEKCYGMIHNMILQLITFYSYDDIKIVLFTNDYKKEEWEYIKYLNHSFSNDKNIRFYSADIESSKNLNEFLHYEIQNRINLAQQGITTKKPYYIVITDDYSNIKRLQFIKDITDNDIELGLSLVIIENQMSKLPSKCNNFISLGKSSSGILTNSFEKQEQLTFHDEINYKIDMMKIVKKLSNIPIEFEEGTNQLPDAITFLEMEKVGKVEQLNIMNRWICNDSTQSLRAEVGVDEEGNLMYLDLHEKYHGPHGLIAGMTGSGKSEFIITYILSMAINYSPDDVSFILIDYKGGGLAGAFMNKTTGINLPHLAGVITNLDKAEMDRTLVSIDSEIKRRQKVFNNARDLLGESTIDIYKYQKYYKEEKLTEAIPHLFIICDEFAELKAQQPDFMDNLISVARIGRSLGVHLILATQKPSGVVNDQIWSNTKFRVCLKVQDAQDSKEMLKRPEAASLKQTGRFYLQVGYDEYFALGQSAWCGAKYYPSEKIIKQVDKSINFIDDTGRFIKSIEAENSINIESQGEQISAILKNIIEVSKKTNKTATRLWLNNIDPIILVDNLEQKYNIKFNDDDIMTIIGEYDAPENQEQGLLTCSLSRDGNTVIYGNDELEKEKLLNTMLYSFCKNYTSNQINIYIADFGSESLRIFQNFPQVGGMVFQGEDEKFNNLFKLIDTEIKNRKKILIPYGGSINLYNSKSQEKLPYILLVLNNYENILENVKDFNNILVSLGRECERYGIILLLTCNTPTTLGRRLGQCFENKYSLRLNDYTDYYNVFNTKCDMKPRDIFGRGLVFNNGIHEFQTASIVAENQNVNDYINTISIKINEINPKKSPPIPTLPEKVTLDLVQKEITTIKEIPIGVYRNSLKIAKYDFTSLPVELISSNKLININSFIDSLLDILLRLKNVTTLFIDSSNTIPLVATKKYQNKKIIYCNTDFNSVLDKISEIENKEEYKVARFIYIFYGIEKLKTKIDIKKLDKLSSQITASDNSNIIICESAKGLKSIEFDPWYAKLKNNSEGIWIGKGLGNQTVFRLNKITKDMTEDYSNNYGFYINEGEAKLIKNIKFNDLEDSGDEEDE